MAVPVKVDLNKLRDEIASEKVKVRGVPQRLGNATGNFAAPKDEFLHGLMTSLQTGAETPSSKLLREVDTHAETKPGGLVKTKTPTRRQPQQQQEETEFYQPRPQQPRPIVLGESEDREDAMYRDFEKMKKSTLADAIQEGLTQRGATQGMQMQPQRYGNQPMAINEQALVENVRGAVNGYLAESLMPILEESTRSVIIEMYAAEKLKTVLKENKDLIKEYIIEVFRELKAKQK